MLCGFAGATIGPGLAMIWKYFYWSHPTRSAEYIEKIENERIELHDERKEMLRNKAGRIVVSLNFSIASVAIVAFAILDSLEIISFSKPIIITLSVFFVLQIVLSHLVYGVLEKRG